MFVIKMKLLCIKSRLTLVLVKDPVLDLLIVDLDSPGPCDSGLSWILWPWTVRDLVTLTVLDLLILTLDSPGPFDRGPGPCAILHWAEGKRLLNAQLRQKAESELVVLKQSSTCNTINTNKAAETEYQAASRTKWSSSDCAITEDW